jgi:hypothetical protein
MNNLSDLPFLKKNDVSPLLILYLYSNKIPQSTEIIKEMSDNLKMFFRFICIDDPKILHTIKKSKTIKLKQIPTVLVVYPSEITDINLNELVHNLNIYLKQSSTKTNFSLIDEDALNDDVKSGSQPIGGNRDSTMARGIPPNQLTHRAPRYKNALNNEYKNMTGSGGDSYSSISSAPNKPRKGMGHGRMAMSSLNEPMTNEDEDFIEPEHDMSFLDESLQITKGGSKEDHKNNILNALNKAAAERQEMVESEDLKGQGLGGVNNNNNFQQLQELDDDDIEENYRR